MDLKALAELKQQNQSHHQNRTQSARKAYQTGLHLLAQAKDERFINPQTLVKAHQAFIEASQRNRRDPAPYIALAYLSLLAQDTLNSGRYLNLAREHDPNHPDIKVFHQQIQSLQKPRQKENKAPARELTELAGTEIDFDALYDKVETLIYREIRRLTEQAPIEPTPSAEVVKALGHQVSELSDLITQTQQHLATLEQELDCFVLKQAMVPLEVFQKRAKQSFKRAQEMRRLRLEMKKITEEVDETRYWINRERQVPNLKDAENQLSDILDRCDRVADQLNDLESQGASIALLETDYENLAVRVAKFQDLLDEVFPY